MKNSSPAATRQDLEQVPGVSAAVVRKLDNDEMVFARASALGLIEGCTLAEIAVLGVEVFPGPNVSTYDLFLKNEVQEASWPEYVRINNLLAEEFLRKNPTVTDAECILTTASWREFCQVQRFRRNIK
jgi:hypothetical protein